MPPKKKAKTEATAAPTAATAAKPSAKLQPCGRTRGELDELKKSIKAGKIDYVDYFYGAPHQLPDGTQVSIDRCKKCGCTIDEHAPGVPTAVAMQVDGMYESISQATVENIDGVPTSDLQVMCSPKGWPAETGQQLCFVRNDVVAIADEFLKDATESIVIIGQPGTGKSFAGGYIVNRCLSAGHKLVVYVVRDSIYAFDADARTCSIVDRRTDAYIDIDRQHPDCILVYDCVKFFPQPPTGKRQGVVAISSPGDGQYAEWAKQVGASKRHHPRCCCSPLRHAEVVVTFAPSSQQLCALETTITNLMMHYFPMDVRRVVHSTRAMRKSFRRSLWGLRDCAVPRMNFLIDRKSVV